jgi:monoamine oxidase
MITQNFNHNIFSKKGKYMRYLFVFIFFFAARLPSHALPTHHIDSQPKITIVGAGLAGLTAAYRLQKLGHPCEIYEARNRPGGRVLTAYFGTAYEELGGKSIYDGGDGVHMLSLIEEMGLQAEIYEWPLTLTTMYEGQLHTYVDLRKDAPEPTEAAFLSLKEKMHAVKSLADLLDPFFAGNKILRHQMELWMTTWEGSAPQDLAPEYLHASFWGLYNKLYDLLNNASPGKPFKRRFGTVAGGNSRLVQALADTLETQIHYGQPLRKITRSADKKIWLHFDTVCISTDYLILALPCSTLRDVAIDAGILPDDQLLAIRTLQYGTSAKILFPIQCAKNLPTEWMNLENWSAFLNKEHSVMTWLSAGSAGIFDAHGTQALTSLIEKEIPCLFQVFPDLVFTKGVVPTTLKEHLFSQYDRPVAISWIHEEFSKGSYSNYGLGTFALFNEFIEEYEESVRKVFRSIDGRIFFAGEHTAMDGDNGTMDGAVYSGERAARMLERAL